MDFKMTNANVHFLQRQSIENYPNECCGFIFGTRAEAAFCIRDLFPAVNERTDAPTRRYRIAPMAYLEAERVAVAAGVEIIGFYHSHPDHPAIPSSYDLEHAWPQSAYLITEIRNGSAAGQRAWILAEDRSCFREMRIIYGGK